MPGEEPAGRVRTRLHLIRLLHTAVWVFFVGCIAAIPLFAWARRYDRALIAIGLVSVEVVVLALNRWTCPLTPVAARFTADRAPNFDIYLPRRIAQYNKEIFGSLFLGGVAMTLARWLGWL